MTSINQEMINKANTKCDAYEAPHLTIIPLRTSGAMLIGSPTTYNYFDKSDEDFILYDNDVDQHYTNKIENYNYGDWNSSF